MVTTTKRNQDTRITMVYVERFLKNDNAVHSRIYINQVFCTFAFENTDFLINEGIYQACRWLSPKFKYTVLRLTVSGHEGIEFHQANKYVQLRGCIAPVCNITSDGGGLSHIALVKLLTAIPEGTDIQVEYKNNWFK